MAAAAVSVFVFTTILAGLILRPEHVGHKDDWKHDGQHTIVRVYAGEWSNEARDNLGGNTPAVTLWDHHGDYWGRGRAKSKGKGKNKAPGTIRHGGFVDIPVKAANGNRRPGYISLTSTGIDAICVAAVSIAHPDGSTDIWTGDLGAYCGYMNYMSTTLLGKSKKAPKCVWIDGDNSARQDRPDLNVDFPQGLSFHIDDMTPTEERAQQYSLLGKSLCGNPARMAVHQKAGDMSLIDVFSPPLLYHENSTDVDLERILSKKGIRQSGKVRRSFLDAAVDRVNSLYHFASRQTKGKRRTLADRFEGQLVRSSNQSAIELCQNPNVVGPDLVSLQEQIFCDLTTRMTWPLCNETLQGACFDAEQAHFVPAEAANIPQANDSVLAAATPSQLNPAANLVAAIPLPIKSYISVVNAV